MVKTMQIQTKLIKNLLIVFSLFTFFGCGQKTTVHYIVGGADMNNPPFGPAIMKWPDGAELFCKFGNNFKIEGKSIFYLPRSNENFVIMWKKGYPKELRPNLGSEEEIKQYLADTDTTLEWWATKYNRIFKDYYKGMSVGKIIKCDPLTEAGKKECERIAKGKR